MCNEDNVVLSVVLLLVRPRDAGLSKALQNVTGNLNLDDSNDRISETPLSLEEKIAKKWCQFEELMEQFDYRNSLVEFVDQLSSTLSYRPSHLLPFLRLLFPLSRPCRQAGLLIWI